MTWPNRNTNHAGEADKEKNRNNLICYPFDARGEPKSSRIIICKAGPVIMLITGLHYCLRIVAAYFLYSFADFGFCPVSEIVCVIFCIFYVAHKTIQEVVEFSFQVIHIALAFR